MKKRERRERRKRERKRKRKLERKRERWTSAGRRYATLYRTIELIFSARIYDLRRACHNPEHIRASSNIQRSFKQQSRILCMQDSSSVNWIQKQSDQR